MRNRRLGLLGGSFDPIHRGHLHAANAAQERFGLDRVIFVPAAEPPHKLGRRLAPGADRLAMVELAIAGEPSWSACDLELNREGPSYTVDTVHELPARVGEAPGVEIFLILGSDNLEGLLDWYRSGEILDRVQPVVIPRDGAPLPDLGSLLKGRPAGWTELFERGLLDLSTSPGRSTDLRATFAKGAMGQSNLPRGVEEYIRARGLYRTR